MVEKLESKTNPVECSVFWDNGDTTTFKSPSIENLLDAFYSIEPCISAIECGDEEYYLDCSKIRLIIVKELK
jgi:hypothetical protein